MYVYLKLVIQITTMDMKYSNTEVVSTDSKCSTLLSDGMILKVSIAICISTTAMAILEPCLPIWLIENLSPKVIFNIIISTVCFFKKIKLLYNIIFYRNGKLELFSSQIQ